MSARERYVSEVLDRIFAGEADRKRLRDDLRSHFEEGDAAGETETEIIGRLGPPDEVAGSFMENVPLRYAGFWVRVLAFVADFGAASTVILPPFCILLVAGAMSSGDDPDLWFLMTIVPVSLWAMAIALLYFPLAEYHFGKTFGKHLVGLRVLQESGSRLTLGKAFLRRLSFYFEFFPLDAIFVPFTERKQRAFDLVAKTIVVREREEIGWVNALACVALLAAPVIPVLALVFLAIE